MENIIIPKPLQIVVDDMGWFCPNDDREKGGPSRTAMSRPHVAADYEAINNLGKALDMKINCAFIIGEWDPDNRLKDIPNLSKWGKDWDNVYYIDKNKLIECIDVINNSPFIDIAVHGLMHGYYIENTDNPDVSDYYFLRQGNLYMIPEREVRRRIEAFFDILKYHGVNKKVNSFVPPSFRTRWGELSRILGDYGIEYISTIFKFLDCDNDKPVDVGIENGIVTLDRNNNLIPWNEISTDFSKLPCAVGVFGAHWPNFLHTDAERNSEVIDSAVKYFKKCGNQFGTVLSRDMEFCANQSLCEAYSVIRNGVVDLSSVPKKLDSFVVSSKREISSCDSARIVRIGDRDGFINYEIYPTTNIVKLSNSSS